MNYPDSPSTATLTRPRLRAHPSQSKRTHHGQHWKELLRQEKLQEAQGGEADGELSSVFGSVLNPKDNWQCVACIRKFKQVSGYHRSGDQTAAEKLLLISLIAYELLERDDLPPSRSKTEFGIQRNLFLSALLCR
jgi:hypothetical protein